MNKRELNDMPLTKVADFPYDEIDVEIKYYTPKKVWVKVKNDGLYRLSRPFRYAWTKLNVGDILKIKKTRKLKAQAEDKIENYYAAFNVVGGNNEVLPCKTKLSSM